MAAICCIYFARMCLLGMVFSGHPDGGWAGLLAFVIDAAMLALTMDAVLGVSSGRQSSWRKVQRSAGMTIVLSALYSFLPMDVSAELLPLNPLVLIPVGAAVMALMLDRRVREHYTPPMMEVRPVRDWIGYILLSDLYPTENFRLVRR